MTETSTSQALHSKSGTAHLKKDQEEARTLRPIVSSARKLTDTEIAEGSSPGVVTYLRYPNGTDAPVRVDNQGNLISESPYSIFQAISCGPDTEPCPHAPNHHQLVARCAEITIEEQRFPIGQLGTLCNPRRKLWERLFNYRRSIQNHQDQTIKNSTNSYNSSTSTPVRNLPPTQSTAISDWAFLTKNW